MNNLEENEEFSGRLTTTTTLRDQCNRTKEEVKKKIDKTCDNIHRHYKEMYCHVKWLFEKYSVQDFKRNNLEHASFDNVRKRLAAVERYLTLGQKKVEDQMTNLETLCKKESTSVSLVVLTILNTLLDCRDYRGSGTPFVVDQKTTIPSQPTSLDDASKAGVEKTTKPTQPTSLGGASKAGAEKPTNPNQQTTPGDASKLQTHPFFKNTQQTQGPLPSLHGTSKGNPGDGKAPNPTRDPTKESIRDPFLTWLYNQDAKSSAGHDGRDTNPKGNQE